MYAIKSNKTGKFLTHLFEDDHYKIFTANVFDPAKCYWYRNILVAKDIAKQLDAKIVFKGKE